MRIRFLVLHSDQSGPSIEPRQMILSLKHSLLKREGVPMFLESLSFAPIEVYVCWREHA